MRTALSSNDKKNDILVIIQEGKKQFKLENQLEKSICHQHDYNYQ